MTAIEVAGLSKAFDGHRAIDGLAFSVEAGEVFGLLGPNGAGKTTTLRILAGLYAPDAGRATVAGVAVAAGRPGGATLRRKVGLLTEQPGFYDRLDARYNLVYFARLYGLGRHEAERRASALLERFDLAQKADAPFGSLSRGMKQKLAIARALLHRPEVVLLDEPTVGLDPEATREVRAIVGELAAEGRTVILCTHHLDEVERLCGRAAFLAGRLVGVHDVAGAAAATRRVVLEVEAPVDGVASVVGAHAAVARSRVEGAALHLELAEGGQVADVVAAAVGAGARIRAVVPARHALEEAYLALLAEARDAGLVP